MTGESPLVETSNASVGEVLNNQTLQSMPTVGRNAFLMAVTVPTVVSSGDTHWNRMQDQTGASALSMGGGGVRANNYLLDGFPVTDISNRSSINPSVEALEDIKVQITPTTPRWAAAAACSTRRRSRARIRSAAPGSCSCPGAHGPNFFARVRGLRTRRYWRDFGAAGAPIKKDKTFFWWAAEGYRDGRTQSGNLHFRRPRAPWRLLGVHQSAGSRRSTIR